MLRPSRLLPAALLAAAFVHGGARAKGEGPPAAGVLALSLADEQGPPDTKSDEQRPFAHVEVAITGRNARNGLALLRASDDRVRIEPAQVAVNPGSTALILTPGYALAYWTVSMLTAAFEDG